LISWINKKEFNQRSEVMYRNNFAKKSLELNVEEVINKYTYLDYNKAYKIVELIKKYIPKSLSGVGLELGAGTGIFSSILASNNINHIYAIELVPALAELVIPRVAKKYLQNKKGKVIPVHGSFDNIKLPDESIDFIFEYDSFHHSNDLKNTFFESYKKLKSGGTLIMFDKCHSDSLSDEEIDDMLNITFSKELLKDQGLHEDLIITRRQNGEHEYRKQEWLSAIKDCGFKVLLFRKFYNKVHLKQLYWYILSKFKLKNEYHQNLILIFLAQRFGIIFENSIGITPMKETGFKGKTLGILQKL